MPNFPASIRYELLQHTNDEYDNDYWKELHALYKGGKALLRDSDIMRELFPRHSREREDTYKARSSRAVYATYPSEIIDHLVGKVMSKPVVFSSSVPEYYSRLLKDATRPGGERSTFNAFLRDVLTAAFITQRAWLRVDLPVMDTTPASLAVQVNSGALDAYLELIDASNVLDWQHDDNGALRWVKVAYCTTEGSFFEEERKRRVWHIYTNTSVATYELLSDEHAVPSDNDEIPLVEVRDHNFGAVPFVEFKIRNGLWAMDKLYSLAKAHFNQYSNLSWFMDLCLHPHLYEFIDASSCYTEESKNAVLNQPRGVGYVQTRNSTDRAEFIGPDPTAFTAADGTLQGIRDEMHRVTHQMALAVDNSASSLRRSGDSKVQDKQSSTAIYEVLGGLLKEFSYRVLDLIKAVRGDTVELELNGLDAYPSDSIGAVASEALVLQQLQIPSKTFAAEYLIKVARLALGDQAQTELVEKVKAEILSNVEALGAPIPDQNEQQQPALDTPRRGEDKITNTDRGRER